MVKDRQVDGPPPLVGLMSRAKYNETMVRGKAFFSACSLSRLSGASHSIRACLCSLVSLYQS